jgi:hypothetical protein
LLTFSYNSQDEEDEEEDEEEGSSIEEAEHDRDVHDDDEDHEEGAADNEEAPAYTNTLGAPVEVGPNGYAVCVSTDSL